MENETEQLVVDKDKAKKFRKSHGYSITFSKLMKKWNCATADEWRALRRKHKKENYVGPKKVKAVTTPIPTKNRVY